MNKRFTHPLLISFVLIFLLSGCVFVNREFRQIRNEIFKEIEIKSIDTEVQFQIDPALLMLSRLVISQIDIDPEVKQYIKDIHKIQIGVYNLHEVRDKPLTIPITIAKRLAQKGYEPMVKTRKKDRIVWIMTQIRGTKLTSMYVVSLEREELVLLEIQGQLERLIEKAIRDHGFNKKI